MNISDKSTALKLILTEQASTAINATTPPLGSYWNKAKLPIITNRNKFKDHISLQLIISSRKNI